MHTYFFQTRSTFKNTFKELLCFRKGEITGKPIFMKPLTANKPRSINWNNQYSWLVDYAFHQSLKHYWLHGNNELPLQQLLLLLHCILKIHFLIQTSIRYIYNNVNVPVLCCILLQGARTHIHPTLQSTCWNRNVVMT